MNEHLHPKFSLTDFDYPLPENLIADQPLAQRTGSRLFFVRRHEDAVSHHRFNEIENFFKPGDVLVLNNTRVLPARLYGYKSANGAKVEALLLKEWEPGLWEALMKPSGRIKQSARICFSGGDSELDAVVMDGPREGSGQRLLKFEDPDYLKKIEQLGHMPLPPYIRRPDCAEDRARYQTVFAAKSGAVAAPTAGLHFDRPLLERLQAGGVEIVYVTLHVGYGTFQPVQCEDVTQHRMHEEWFEISEDSARAVNRALKENRRVIACGTTSVRVLESAAQEPGRVKAACGQTRLFIYPPYSFKIVTGLITNFHLPQSTLLMLVAAFLNDPDPPQRLLALYRTAVLEQYRFFSYGDAMLIL
ncbi:MAG: tRNA preQ1(34) S-adenosylmethionine ribosyltransferase-isomerase QueA [Candidatus Omnitrophica bacterium]|nr:tRNA preQ1(34) S-adenosylmethionine ribosyltransferase-isomerase QueA [Candidatus Omnitrophota bacterium]